MTCLICVHSDLKKNPHHARAGICHCGLNSEKYIFNSLSHTCENFKEIEEKSASMRKEWDSKRYMAHSGHLSSNGALVTVPLTKARLQYLKDKAERQRSIQKSLDSIRPVQLTWRSK